MSTGTLLGVWAHPDDETFSSAGLMAAAVARGERVVVVTATAGERGTDDPRRWPPRRLASLRRRELRAALAAVGVSEHTVLGFPDGACAEHDGTEAIADVIASVRPDTIVTFGPDGMTGHPDHRAVSAWTTAAWEQTGASAQLWHATLTPEFHSRWGALNADLGLWVYTGQPPCTKEDDLAVLLRLDGAALDRKLDALRAHWSQTAGLFERLGTETLGAWTSTEAFVGAAVASTLAGSGCTQVGLW